MEFHKITEVVRDFNVSTRTLQYYERIGLLKSAKLDDYAYRAFDGAAITRLQRIILLRKLRIPLKQIAVILDSESAAEIIETFRVNLSEVEDEITALSTIRGILDTFISRLNENARLDIKAGLFDDMAVLDIADSLTVTKINFKEKKTMEDLKKASETLNSLTDRDVRIVYLPPATVAASYAYGRDAEESAGNELEVFVKKVSLAEVKPDFRMYGFDAPQSNDLDTHGHEFWVTVPEGMDVPAPLKRKYFEGGLYAAHMIPFGAFDEWMLLYNWVANSPEYELNSGSRGDECMHGCMEEQLNIVNRVGKLGLNNIQGMQLDLLMPIRERK